MPRDHITVDVESIARNLMEHNVTEKLKGAAADRATASCHRLSRVPVHLRNSNANDYTPGFVAIGPLHNHGSNPEDEHLRPAERLKVAYLHNLISRGDPDKDGLDLIQKCVRVVAHREWEARAMYLYEDVVDITALCFVRMMVLDGCFIIEHLVNFATGEEERSLHSTPFGPAQLSIDLVLAENQMPFFVLVDLIATIKPPEFDTTGYAPPELLVKLVLFYLAGTTGRDMSGKLPAAEGVSHILHLLHEMITATTRTWRELPAVMETAQETAQEAEPKNSVQPEHRLPVLLRRLSLLLRRLSLLLRRLPVLLRRLSLLLFVPPLYLILPDDRKRSASYGREDVASASELKRLGVQFKNTRGVGPRIFLDEIGVAKVVLGPVPLAVKLMQHPDLLHLPQIRLEFRTAPLLLNLMAFEQSTTTAQDVSEYVCFMAKMVQSAKDAGVLAAAGVLLLHGGAGNETKEEAARFFRAMGAASEAGGAGNDTKEGAERFFPNDAESGGKLPERSYLDEVLKKLRERSRHPLLVMWADVQRNYFTLLAELLTLVTFVSTLIQTYAAFRYH